MSIDKVFPRPTVKQVIFQIQFPNLFYLETKIPDFQLDIMKDFPESALIVNQPINFTANQQNNEHNNQFQENSFAQKIWEFKNPDGYVLSVTSNSLAITSDLHKTYDNNDSTNRFRDIIEQCLNIFKKHINLPFVNRIGLRYIDECPIKENTSKIYHDSFNSALSENKYNIEDIEDCMIRVVKKSDEYRIIYHEVFNFLNDGQKFVILDFDSFALNVKFDECLQTTDKLHSLISDEFEKTIKQPIIDYMENKDNEY